MHSNIYQLSSKPITGDDFIRSECFEESEWSDFADYLDDCYEEEDTYDEAYERFPLMGIFKRDGDCLTYLGEGDVRKRWMDEISEHMVNEDNINNDMARFTLCRSIERPFTNNRFSIEDWAMLPQTSGEFLTYVLNNMEKGDRLYLGGVVDFHF